MALPKPPKNFALLPLPTVSVDPKTLFRISRHASGEPYFGRSGQNRFDDDSRPKAGRFGVSYFGFSLITAMGETVLHDQVAKGGQFAVSASELKSRFLVRFDGSPLILANLTGMDLKALGGDGSISTELPAKMPRRWSRGVHAHPAAVDGLLYVSRHINTELAVALFDRASAKLTAKTFTPLPKARKFSDALFALHISIQFP